VVTGVTYIPIPTGPGGSFAGLLTVDLPNGIKINQTFDIVACRIATKQVTIPAPPPTPKIEIALAGPPPAKTENVLVWRYITGSFLMKIPVRPESTILPVDENLLAVLKWRLGLIGPGNRWYPVILRYISYLSGRIDGRGGHASQIPPSPIGYQPPSKGGPARDRERCNTGKVMRLCFDRFGDFEGFDFLTETGEAHWFRAQERNIEDLVYRAWVERFVITVCVGARHPHEVISIALDRAPRPLPH
jgi:hypothetical protein